MKTFLKVLLVLVAAILVVKLMPAAIALGFVLGGAILVAAAIGISAAALMLCVALGLIALTSPLWIPVLALVGAIALFKRIGRNSAPA